MSDLSDKDEVQLSAIVASSDDAIIGMDRDGKVTSWNAAAERIFGFSADEAVGKTVGLIIPSEREREESEVLRKLISNDRVEHFETVRRAKMGASSMCRSPCPPSAMQMAGLSAPRTSPATSR